MVLYFPLSSHLHLNLSLSQATDGEQNHCHRERSISRPQGAGATVSGGKKQECSFLDLDIQQPAHNHTYTNNYLRRYFTHTVHADVAVILLL